MSEAANTLSSRDCFGKRAGQNRISGGFIELSDWLRFPVPYQMTVQ